MKIRILSLTLSIFLVARGAVFAGGDELFEKAHVAPKGQPKPPVKQCHEVLGPPSFDPEVGMYFLNLRHQPKPGTGGQGSAPVKKTEEVAIFEPVKPKGAEALRKPARQEGPPEEEKSGERIFGPTKGSPEQKWPPLTSLAGAAAVDKKSQEKKKGGAGDVPEGAEVSLYGDALTPRNMDVREKTPKHLASKAKSGDRLTSTVESSTLAEGEGQFLAAEAENRKAGEKAKGGGYRCAPCSG